MPSLAALRRLLAWLVAGMCGGTSVSAQACNSAAKHMLSAMASARADSVRLWVFIPNQEHGPSTVAPQSSSLWRTEVQQIVWCGSRVIASALALDAHALCREMNRSSDRARPLCDPRQAADRQAVARSPVVPTGGTIRRAETDDGFGGETLELELRFVDHRNGRTKNVKVVLHFIVDQIAQPVINSVTSWGIS